MGSLAVTIAGFTAAGKGAKPPDEPRGIGGFPRGETPEKARN
jgi:hypothetical protein